MIETQDGLRIIVSNHAARQAQRRIPELQSRRTQDAVFWLEHEALMALRAQRKAKNCPRWCVRTWTNGHSRRLRLSKPHEVKRFLWDENQTCAMIAALIEKNTWLVVTAMVPENETVPA